MRIEVDTKSDSKEELRHLANMLMALSSSASSNVVVKSRNIFDDPSPSVGMMGMFGDNSGSQTAQQQSQPSQQSSPSMFSIFSDSPQPSSQPALAVSDEGENKTSAEDILDDDRIQLY
jgi:hypothetical protein